MVRLDFGKISGSSRNFESQIPFPIFVVFCFVFQRILMSLPHGDFGGNLRGRIKIPIVGGR